MQGELDSELKILQQRRTMTSTFDKCTKPAGTGTDYPAMRRCHRRLSIKSYAGIIYAMQSCCLCEDMRKKWMLFVEKGTCHHLVNSKYKN